MCTNHMLYCSIAYADRGRRVLHVSRPQLLRDAFHPGIAELAGWQIEARRGEGLAEVAREGRPQLHHRGQ